jgi:hypothetical protein
VFPKVRDQVSHQYSTTSKITVLYIFMVQCLIKQWIRPHGMAVSQPKGQI